MRALQVAKAPARSARRRFGVVDRWATELELAAMMLGANPVVVYAMGKSGTTALERGLEASLGRPLVKFHSLDPARLRRQVARFDEPGRPRFLWRSQAASRLRRLPVGPTWDVMTTVRDPIARAVSAHFYNLGLRGIDAHPDPARHVDDVVALLRVITVHEDWFRQELEAQLGVNVYAEPFDPAVGWRTYVGERCRVLLVRSEDLRRVGPDVLAEFFDHPSPIALADVNVGRGRDPGSPQRRFLDEAVLPTEAVADACASPMVRHFYAPSERVAMAERWTRTGDR